VSTPARKGPRSNPQGWNAKYTRPLVESGPVTVTKYRDGLPISEEIVAARPPDEFPRLGNFFFRARKPDLPSIGSPAIRETLRAKRSKP